MNKLFFVLGLSLLISSSGYCIESPSLDLGKTLFEATELGSKGRSCESCHAEGKGLDAIGDFNDTELKDIVNACLRDALGAETISTEAQEMEALVGYIRKFQR